MLSITEMSKIYFIMFDLSLLFLIGLVAGLLSGLLGIGGGIILVPSLFFILPYLSSFTKLMQTVIATSLSAMVFTTFLSFLFRLKTKSVELKNLTYLPFLIIIGCLFGSLTSHLISHETLVLIFSFFLMLISLKFFFNWDFKLKTKKKKIMIIAGPLIGFISSFFGIGGGVIALPLFMSFNFPLETAIGTSAFATFLTSFFGSISYAAIGYFQHIKQADSFGYVYIPAFISIGIAMLITTPIGVWISKLMPTKLLKKIFAVILFITAINMIRYLF